jgi:hypothetical protein
MTPSKANPATLPTRTGFENSSCVPADDILKYIAIPSIFQVFDDDNLTRLGSRQPPLLMLAEGRRPTPRKTVEPREKEIELSVAVAKILRGHAKSSWQRSHIPHDEAHDIRAVAKLKRRGAQTMFSSPSRRGSWRSMKVSESGR